MGAFSRRQDAALLLWQAGRPAATFQTGSNGHPLRLARNAAAALLRTGGRALAWQSILVSDQVAAVRQQVCQNGCTFYRPSDSRCAHLNCGCYLAGKLLSKWKLITEQCPLKKWPV